MDEPTLGQVDVEQIGDIAVVRLVGEHDLSNAGALSKDLRSFAGEGLGVVVDLGEVEFVDLAVMRALLEVDETLQANRRRLVLRVGTSAIVERLLETSGLLNSFVNTDDLAEALVMARRERQ